MKKEKGQALVEFALILPLLLLLLMGIIEFGRVFNAYIVLTNLSREGARYAATGESYGLINTKLLEDAKVIGEENLMITISPDEGVLVRGQPVSVKMELDLPLFVPVISSVLPNPFHLAVESTMRVE